MLWTCIYTNFHMFRHCVHIVHSDSAKQTCHLSKGRKIASLPSKIHVRVLQFCIFFSNNCMNRPSSQLKFKTSGKKMCEQF